MELTLAEVVIKDPLPDENGQTCKGLRVELPGGAVLVMMSVAGRPVRNQEFLC